MTKCSRFYVQYNGNEILCEAENFPLDKCPKFIVCRPVDQEYPKEFIATCKNTSWHNVKLIDVIKYYEGLIASIIHVCDEDS